MGEAAALSSSHSLTGAEAGLTGLVAGFTGSLLFTLGLMVPWGPCTGNCGRGNAVRRKHPCAVKTGQGQSHGFWKFGDFAAKRNACVNDPTHPGSASSGKEKSPTSKFLVSLMRQDALGPGCGSLNVLPALACSEPRSANLDSLAESSMWFRFFSSLYHRHCLPTQL